MKTVFFLAALMLSAVSFAGNGTEDQVVTTSEQAGDAGIGRAIAAIRSSCGVTGDLEYNVTTESICFVDGFIRKVNFYQVPNCPPNQPCIQVIFLIGTVTLDCEDNVINVECGVPVGQ